MWTRERVASEYARFAGIGLPMPMQPLASTLDPQPFILNSKPTRNPKPQTQTPEHPQTPQNVRPLSSCIQELSERLLAMAQSGFLEGFPSEGPLSLAFLVWLSGGEQGH